MQDIETASLWSQISGECIQGEKEGSKLTLFPAIHTSYKEFKRLYPDGQLLKKPEKGEAMSHYDGYFKNPEKLGIFGRLNDFERLEGKAYVYGIHRDGRSVAVSQDYLARHGYAMIEVFDKPMVLTYDKDSKTAAAFQLDGFVDLKPESLSYGNRVLSLKDTGLSWSAETGKILSGKGENLRLVPAMTSFWFAWMSFFPETELIK